MIAPKPTVWAGGLSPCDDPGMMDTLGSVGSFWESPEGGSGLLEEDAFGFAGGSPEPAGSEVAFGSDGGSPLSFGEAAELSGTEAGSAEATTGDCVGLVFPGSPVCTGEAAGSLGRDAGLATLVEGTAPFANVVGSAGAGAGVGVGLGRSKAAGLNAIGGSKRANVTKSPI